jgi:hypothetical protein
MCGTEHKVLKPQVEMDKWIAPQASLLQAAKGGASTAVKEFRLRIGIGASSGIHRAETVRSVRLQAKSRRDESE